MRDLHSADLPIGTTEPITSHNESLQVVKSSAIAKHLTEWSGILWKTSITQGIQQSWDSTGCSRLHMQSSPIWSSWQTVSWENHCTNLELDAINRNWNREIPTPSATTNWKTLRTVHSWLCGERDPFPNWMPKLHTFERSIIQRSNYNRSWLDLIWFDWCFTVQNIERDGYCGDDKDRCTEGPLLEPNGQNMKHFVKIRHHR